MGSWGTGTFENDSALDWQDGFLASGPRPGKLKACFNRMLKHKQADADLAMEALAAAEVLSGLRGHPSTGLPDELADWISASRGKLQDEWRELARQAVERVATASELRELWQEADRFDEWQSELKDLLGRLDKPAQPKAKRPKGPKIWMLRRNGNVARFTYVASDPKLPNLSAPDWQINSVRINVLSAFSASDYQVLGGWLSNYPEVLVIFEDGQFGEVLQVEDDAWQAVEDGLLAFSETARVRLELSPLRNLEFLTRFHKLRDLEIYLSAPCDVSALPRLGTLKRLGVQTSTGNLFDAASLAAAPRFDLAALAGVAATSVGLEHCRLINAPQQLSALQHCDTLIFDYFFEEGVFEMPSLHAFTSLKRLRFLPLTAQCLLNALDAPALQELVIYTDKETLDPAMDRIRNSPTLTHLTIMLQPAPLEPFNEAEGIVVEVGKQSARVESW